MAYNEFLAERLSRILQDAPEFTEKKMFGGLAYLYKGKMTVGIVKEDLMVRILEPKCSEILAQDYAKPMNFTGKTMKEFVYITEEGCATDKDLEKWISLGLAHAKSKLKE